ncbi:DUF7534 family protein [Haladaptatus caseinilyticus]|uniref:DUF7534 family protein n=1 Tax=Haladaptatus caseinilyticus TaxID=2993314 RepID=UPI00224B5817|nr:hypothetical protein [Haladaptatus caseinilyticus]
MPSLPPVYLVSLAMYVVTVLSVNYWVYSDATARGSSFPSFWSISSVFFWLPALYYFIRYRHLHERQRPPTRGNRIAQTLAISSLSATVVTTFFAPPDQFTRTLLVPACFAGTLSVTYVLVYRRQYKRIPGIA